MDPSLTWEAWFTLGSVGLLIAALATSRIGADTAMLTVLTIMVAAGVVSPADAVMGFGDPAVVTIAALFVVASGLSETGALEPIANKLLGRPKSIAGAQLRLMAPVAAMSAFMSNTSVVAIYLPILQSYARRLNASVSKLYMPLAFASILGGSCTLIGTSSNVIANGLYLDYFDAHAKQLIDMGLTRPSTAKQFWWITTVGLPASVLGLFTIALTSRWLLPERITPDVIADDARSYTTSVTVEPGGPIAGKTIEQAGLRHLPGLFLFAIERETKDGYQRLPAVGPEQLLRADDRLLFSGVVDSVVELHKMRGLAPATDEVGKVQTSFATRTIVEAVVSATSTLVGKTVRESNFRGRFNAAIIAVHRGGHRVEKRIGDIRLLAGDTLLLSTHEDFVTSHRNSNHFYLVSDVAGGRPPRRGRAWIALSILLAMVAMFTLPLGQSPLSAALLCAVAMVLTRCTSGTAARNAIGWQVLLVIGAALGIGKAMAHTGAADAIVHLFDAATAGLGPRTTLFVFSLAVAAFSQLVSNKVAAVLMLPIAVSVSVNAGLSPEPFVVTLMASTACSFLTPIGFVVNMMVYAPGGYRFADFIRLGLPVQILVAVLCALITPLFFPFQPG